MTDDLPLRALLAAAEKCAPALSRDFISKAYALQVQHQFDKDREISVRDLAHLAESHISAAGAEKSGRK